MSASTTPRILLLFLAVALAIAACGGSDSSDTAATTTEAEVDETTTEAPTTTAAVEDETEMDDAAMDDDGDTAPPTSTLSDDEVVDATLDITGLDLTDDERTCIKNDFTAVDGLRTAENEAQNLLLLSTFRCAPETLAIASSVTMDVEEVDSEELQCAMTQAIIVIGELSNEDALASITSVDYPEIARPDALARGQAECGLTEEQVAAVLAS